MPKETVRITLIQLTASSHPENNFKKTCRLLNKAMIDRPEIICLPETFLYFGTFTEKNMVERNSPWIKWFQEFARKNKVHLILGSLLLRRSRKQKPTNTTLVIHRGGRVVHAYHKKYWYIVKRKDFIIDESRHTSKGVRDGIVVLDGIRIGLGICVDLRYPEYFRRLVRKGAEIIFLPSSFRTKTGSIAWRYLTRARAIENQVYFCACNQTGGKGNEARCGETCIVSFDGSVMKRLPVREGTLSVTISLKKLRVFRKKFPVLNQ